MSGEWTAPPIEADGGKHTMLYQVPVTRSRRQMAHGDMEFRLVGEFLQLPLEEVHAISIALTPVGGDQELHGLGIRRAAHASPPLADAGDGKFRRVVVGADIDPP